MPRIDSPLVLNARHGHRSVYSDSYEADFVMSSRHRYLLSGSGGINSFDRFDILKTDSVSGLFVMLFILRFPSG